MEAWDVPGVGVSGDLGAGVVGGVGASAGACDSRARGRRGYREAQQSVAFPGWTVAEIYGALTEEPL